MKKRGWIIIGVLIFSLLSGCSTSSVEGEKMDQPKEGELPPVQETSFDVATMNVEPYFSNQEGTFVLRDLENNQTLVYNEERANTRQGPESTFKIVNALIGLEVEAVRDEHEVKRWDGTKRFLDVWNADHTLASGMKYSVVWYYQALARDIGEERMQEWLDKINYGNKDISAGIDTFWLNSSLGISPVEQVDFLSKLAQESLPFQPQHMKTVKRMIIQDEQENYTLYGKTGTRPEPPVGWFVGFVKTTDNTYVFAANVDGEGMTSAQKAKEITLNILKDHKIIGSSEK
nr:class D beta-lactamase [Caldalkalibacillus mannanilyticus]